MQVYLRVAEYIWLFRRQFILSVICAVIVSMFWAVNLSIAFPIVKVLFENDSIHAYVDSEIAKYDSEIQKENLAMAALRPDQVERLAVSQTRLSTARHSLAFATWLQRHVLPWVPEDKFNTIIAILGILLVATLFKGLFTYIQELLVGSFVQLTANSIRQACFRSALRLDYQSLHRMGESSLMSRMTNDIEQMTGTIRIFGISLVREPLKAAGCIIVAFLINWRLTLLTLTVVPLLGFTFYRFSKLLRDASHRSMQSMASIYSTISETFGASKIVLAFSGYRRHRKQFLRANRDYYEDSMRIVRLGSLIRPLTEIMGVVAMFAALGPGAYLVLRNTNELWGIQLASRPMDIAELSMLYAMLLGTLDPVRRLSGVFTTIKRGMAGSERVFELIDEKSIIPEPRKPHVLVRHSSTIFFQDLSFRYQASVEEEQQRPLALKNVSLEVKFGEVVASTLAAMFSGMMARKQWNETRGDNILDTGAPWYDTYETADGKYVAIGAIEPKFYTELLERMGLASASGSASTSQNAEALPNQHDRAGWPTLRARFAATFKTKTRDEWDKVFDGSDACFAPVLTFSEAREHPHMAARGTFMDVGRVNQPAPSPRFSRTPGAVRSAAPERGQHGRQALTDWGFGPEEIAALNQLGLGGSA